jgi:hypothetical protein
MRVYAQVQWPIDTCEPVVYVVVSGGCPSASWLASVSARSFPCQWLCALILPRCADACVAASFEGVCDGEERFAVDVVSVSGWAV